MKLDTPPIEDASAGAHERAAVLPYVVVTPARNEAAFIESLIHSITSQTITPLRWVIVSDGSTDGTDDIVRRYAGQYPWISLLRMPERAKRSFAGKVHALNAGFESVQALPYRAVASMDADLTVDPDHFEFLLDKLASDPSLGLVGTPFEEDGSTYDYRFVSLEHVSGACQLFRRECFEAVGGYVPNEAGGVDHVAVLTARYRGWQTRTFPGRVARHHRKQGSASRGTLRRKYHIGRLDYALGGHPLWEVARAAYQMTQPPYVIGGMLILLGYFGQALRGRPRSIPQELVRFRHGEQMRRLKHFLFGHRARTH